MIPHASVTPAPRPVTPAIPRLVVFAGPCVVGAAAAVASFKFTAEFGRHNAWPGLSSYLLPATVDGLAVVAWWKAAFAGGGRLAWACGWGTTAVSVAANAAGHAGVTGEAWTVVAGGWPALCLALMVHLLWFPSRTLVPALWAEVEDPVTYDAEPVAEDRDPEPEAPRSHVHLVRAEDGDLRWYDADEHDGPCPEPASSWPARDRDFPPWPDASGLLNLLGEPVRDAAPAGPAPTPVMDSTARALMAVGLTDAALAEHAKREGVTAVLKLRSHYDLSHDRARAVNRLIFPKTPGGAPPASPGPSASAGATALASAAAEGPLPRSGGLGTPGGVRVVDRAGARA